MPPDKFSQFVAGEVKRGRGTRLIYRLFGRLQTSSFSSTGLASGRQIGSVQLDPQSIDKPAEHPGRAICLRFTSLYRRTPNRISPFRTRASV